HVMFASFSSGFFCFFFSSRRRHTRSKRDWSSDVCSSDLLLIHPKDGPFSKLLPFLHQKNFHTMKDYQPRFQQITMTFEKPKSNPQERLTGCQILLYLWLALVDLK